jgi:catechol 2,3-dioxygenase-like lactoylglutathione lyase family enzyme
MIKGLLIAAVAASLWFFQTDKSPDKAANSDPNRRPDMELGAFSVSLAVKDISASKQFYEKLGFKSIMGEVSQKWLIMQSGTTTIGLFQGAIPRNTLTFNPGWANKGPHPDKFMDIREIQRELKKSGLTPTPAADESTKGPAFFMLTDPDGNPVLFDQHR